MRPGRLREVETQWPGHPAESELGLEPRPKSAACPASPEGLVTEGRKEAEGREGQCADFWVPGGRKPPSSPPCCVPPASAPGLCLLSPSAGSEPHPPSSPGVPPLQPHPAVPPCSPFGLWAPSATPSPCPPDMQSLRTAQAALGKGCLASSFICVYLFTGELYPTEIRWGPGAGEGVRKGAGPELGGSHSRLVPAGFAEAGPDLRPALPPTPRSRRARPSGRPGHSR